MKSEDTLASAAGVRLDLWLWAARFFKTRSLAKQQVEAGKVEVNDIAGKPSKLVHVGDVLKIVRGEERFEIAVAGLSTQRGPAATARRRYREAADQTRQARTQAHPRARRHRRILKKDRRRPSVAGARMPHPAGGRMRRPEAQATLSTARPWAASACFTPAA